jgi:hypothetical protein
MIAEAMADLSAYVPITTLVVLIVFIGRHFSARLLHWKKGIALGDLLRERSL